MQNQLLITKKEDMYLSAWAEDGRIRQIQADSLEPKAVLGNIYVGKVRNVVKNINAAFIEFQKGQMGYLSLNDCKHPIHTDGVIRNDDRVLIGDEIIVQVDKDKAANTFGKAGFFGQIYRVICRWGTGKRIKKDQR